MKAHGIDLVLGFDDGTNVWTPTNCDYAGIRLGLRWGPIMFIVPKFWSKTWDHDHFPTPKAVWFTFKLPFVIMPYLCVSVLEASAYVGAKFIDSERTCLYWSVRYCAHKAGR